jgi:hypothetical protein
MLIGTVCRCLYRVGHSIVDCFLQVCHRHCWGGCEKKDLHKPMGGGPSYDISGGWGGQNSWHHRDCLPPNPREEFCSRQQHFKIWEDFSNSKTWLSKWKISKWGKKKCSKRTKRQILPIYTADGRFSLAKVSRLTSTKSFWHSMQSPGRKDTSWSKICLSPDSVPAYTAKTTQWQLTEFWIPMDWRHISWHWICWLLYLARIEGERPGYASWTYVHPSPRNLQYICKTCHLLLCCC